jgi:hypothetical protein
MAFNRWRKIVGGPSKTPQTMVQHDVESYFDSYELKIHHFLLLPITWKGGQPGITLLYN